MTPDEEKRKKEENDEIFETLQREESFVEKIGFVLFFFDQVANIVFIFSNQFVSDSLYWSSVGIWILNIVIVFKSCFENFNKAKYYRPALQIFALESKTTYGYAKVVERIIQILIYIFQWIILVLGGLIANTFTIILIWFGFTKLYCETPKIYDFLCFMVLGEEKYYKNKVNPSGEQTKQESQLSLLIGYSFKMEIAQKICESTPQLILKFINQQIGIVQSQRINTGSILLSMFNIAYFISLVVKTRSCEVQKKQSEVLEQLKKHSKIPCVVLCQAVQLTFYFILILSYEWSDYVNYKNTWYGKDADDSIRVFIMMYPVFLVYYVFLIAYKKEITFLSCYVCQLKNLFLILFLIDVWSFKPEHLSYGQKVLGKEGSILFIILLIFTVADRVFLCWEQDFYQNNKMKYEIKIMLVQFGIIYILKSFSQFINNAHYYDFTPFEDKTGECNEKLESTLQGVLILYIFRFFILGFGVFGGGFISIIAIVFQILVFVFDCLLLHFQTKYSFCDDLRYTQRHYYTTIFDILVGLIGFFMSIKSALLGRKEKLFKYYYDKLNDILEIILEEKNERQKQTNQYIFIMKFNGLLFYILYQHKKFGFLISISFLYEKQVNKLLS